MNGYNTPRRDAAQFAYPVALGALVLEGGMVAINGGGLAVQASADASLTVVGVAEKRADARVSAEGVNAFVRRGCFGFKAGEAITTAAIGDTCYAMDAVTVSLTDGTGTRPKAGIIRDVSEGRVWVEI